MEAIKNLNKEFKQIKKPAATPEQKQYTLNNRYSYLLNIARDIINQEMQDKFNQDNFKPLTPGLTVLDYQIYYNYESICGTIHFDLINMYLNNLLMYLKCYNLSIAALKPISEFIIQTNNIYLLNSNRFGNLAVIRHLIHKYLKIPYQDIVLNYNTLKRIINNQEVI